MNLLNHLRLWSANRQLHSLSLEIAAARDYEGDVIVAYEDEGRSRSDLAEEILEVRRKVEYLDEQRTLVLARIAGLRAGNGSSIIPVSLS